MESGGIMQQILIQYQKKNGIVNEIFRLTKEMVDLLAYDDRVSTQLVLSMRQEEMGKADQCNLALAELEDRMSIGERQRLYAVVAKGEDGCLPETWEEKKLVDICHQIDSTLSKTIEVDKRVNMKLAGKDSYYRQ